MPAEVGQGRVPAGAAEEAAVVWSGVKESGVLLLNPARRGKVCLAAVAERRDPPRAVHLPPARLEATGTGKPDSLGWHLPSAPGSAKSPPSGRCPAERWPPATGPRVSAARR